MNPESYALSPLEVAVGSVFGPDLEPPPLPEPEVGVSPREALEESVLAALLRPPCGVSFSGGRDSSLVLAVATHVARREGLALPIPLTHLFPAVPDSREDGWQELVVRALGIADWDRMSWAGEMDVLGQFAAAALRRVGVVDPFNAFFHEPLYARVAGGSLLTGVGGDEMLAGVLDGPAFRIRYRGRRPRLRHLGQLVRSYAPPAQQARRLRAARPFAHLQWVRPGPRREAETDHTRWQAASPLAWDRAVLHFWRSRDCHVGLRSLDALAEQDDVHVVHPLSSPGFVAAMTAEHGHAGPGSRSAANARLVGDLLPPDITGRADKAAFGGAFWTGEHADFADAWTGGGVDENIVDAERLRAEWRRPEGPHVASLLLLHQAWLHDDGLRAASAQ